MAAAYEQAVAQPLPTHQSGLTYQFPRTSMTGDREHRTPNSNLLQLWAAAWVWGPGGGPGASAIQPQSRSRTESTTAPAKAKDGLPDGMV
ncbi:unnamed protein product [Boreogadus saida]